MRKAFRVVATTSVLLSAANAAGAAPEPAVPDPLRPWIGWVMHGEAEESLCPTLHGRGEDDGERVCAWPARLSLAIDERGGSFTQEWEVWKKGWVGLPGNAERWPLDVRVDGKPGAVIDDDDAPRVELAVGRHVVSGRFAWDSLPDALAVPDETGLLALKVRGKAIDFPLRDDDGRVFLGRQEDEATEDAVDISVHRRLTDEIPLLLDTRLVLAVSGKNRELVLGRALPDGFEPMAVESGLPLRFEPDGRIRVQSRPGSWTITITARRVTPDKTVTRPKPEGGLWKEGEEVWVFDARPGLRLVTIEGVAAIDPAQTTLPEEWKTLPAYALGPGVALTLAERRRGDGEPAPDELNLQRKLWLDFDGGGYTASDQITGRFVRSWRLEMGPETKLGRAAVDGRDQFITRLGTDGRDGVEIRSGRASISASSRIEGAQLNVPATSFAHDFTSVSATLALPPGWRLFHASGADKTTGTWIETWTLLDLFLMLIVAIATHRLFGWKAGALAAGALVLTVTEHGAPALVWLALLLGEALVRALREGKLAWVVRAYRAGVLVALVVIFVPYAIDEVRRGLHPASSREQMDVSDQVEERSMSFSKASAPVAGLSKGTREEILQNQVAGTAVPASPAEAEESAADAKDEPKAARPMKRRMASKSVARTLGYDSIAQNAQLYDPTVVVQTGPGLPRWNWTEASLSFNGPVAHDQTLRLWLVPPWLNAVLAFLRVGLLAALAFFLLRRPLRLTGGNWLPPRPLLIAALLLAGGMRAGPASAAEFPSPELLEQLKQRLTEAPTCLPDCASLNRMELQASARELHLLLDVSTAARTAIPLPGDKSGWSPASVRVDGRPATALARTDDGTLWLALPAGVARVEVSGPLPARDAITLALPLHPRYTLARATGWSIDGVHEDGAVDDSVKLSREAGASKGAAERGDDTAAPVLPPFLQVDRTLHLNLKWEVDTTVRRQTALGAPLVIDIPLLPGESVTTPGVRVDKARGTATVSLGPDQAEALWHSTLSEASVITLKADPAHASRWAETWHLDLGPTWHAAWTGIAPLAAGDAAARLPTWRPLPGEQVRIDVTKPGGAPGQTLTIDAATLTLTPGVRMTQAGLALDLRSSRGTQHTLTLPEGAELDSVQRDGTGQPLRLEGRRLVLPVSPGKQAFVVSWRQPTPLSLLFRAPEVDLGTASSNTQVVINLSQAPRWTLWVGGPRLGPAVHFWSVLVVLVLLAWALARTALSPLGMRDWVLVGLGLSQLPLPAGIVFALTLLALGWRARHPMPVGWAHNLSQLIAALLITASVAILIGGIEEGLLSHPDMRVAGNGSHDSLLNWYQDRSGPVLPRPFVLSTPMLVYRGVMLVWSLWLALASLRWARWVWARLRENGLWQSFAAKREPPPPAAP